MEKLQQLKEELTTELCGNILPFWMDRVTDTGPRGGFHGRITGEGKTVAEAPRGAVMYARILWTFASAYRMFGKPEYLETARRAKDHLLDKFYDKQYGGLYWTVDTEGEPLDTRKQFYALGFAIYGLSELYRAAMDRQALSYAVKLFETIEAHSFDPVNNGYIEALTREWAPSGDMRLSEKDRNESRTMNTHLHILEPYTNLYRALVIACGENGSGGYDAIGVVELKLRVKERLENLISIFLEKIYRPSSGHLGLFFSDDWTERSAGAYSYGHDVEASWLLLEAARTAGNSALTGKVMEYSSRIADASLEGYRPDGSMIYEKHPDGRLDEERHWWVQAEAVVGLFYLWRFHGRQDALDMALMSWHYIKNRLVDRQGGEWFWSVAPDGGANLRDDKAGPWKCPYHNGRMCMELISLL